MKHLAIDYGSKRIGTALSDEAEIFAFPHVVIDAEGAVRKTLTAIVADHEIGHIVLGMPLDRKGNEGKAAEGVRVFAEKLKNWFGLPVTLWDERHTTVQANRMMNNRAKGNADLMAATLILQSYLASRETPPSSL